MFGASSFYSHEQKTNDEEFVYIRVASVATPATRREDRVEALPTPSTRPTAAHNPL